MPRPIRIQYSGAWYHVMNKMACGADLFHDNYDRQMFLSYLAQSVQRTAAEVHAYCLMGNHYHLLIRTPTPSLEATMRFLGSGYARYFNDRYERDGMLCRSRYKSIVIDSERYLLAVSRYIHRNPLSLGVTSLADYGWSSYSAFVGAHPPQDWLELGETLSLVGGPRKYEQFVESPFLSEIESIYERPRLPTILGSQRFKAEVRAKGA